MKLTRHDHPDLRNGDIARIVSMYPERTASEPIQPKPLKRLALPTAEGIHLIDMKTITYCCADGNYTHLHLDNGNRLVISRTLGVLDELLTSPQFIRVHQSWLVQVDRISCLKPEQLVMDCGTVIPVSRSRRAEVRRLVILGSFHWPTSRPESQ